MNKIISFLLSCLLHTSLVLASTYTLRVELTPNGAGSLNTTGGTYEVGESIYLRSYNNTGFVFKGWYEGDSLLASSSTMYYTMPAKDVLVQAKYEYDPTVPLNPAMPDTTKVVLYSFTASVSPEGAGTLNTYGGEYEEDESLYLRAYQNTNFYFKEWVDENGKVLTTSSSFYYTMPSSDTHLTAVYYYDPTVPSNPDSIATRYTVNVISKPNGGGTFNTNQISSEAGNNVRLYAYTNTGFQFKHWENESGDKLSTSQTFDYTIPNADSKVYGVFEYNPQVPSNPNKNNWDKSTGEVIVDDFKTGSLNSAISQVTDGNSTEVTMITVSGKMSSNDFGIANNYSNCTLIDLKRTYGFKEIPSYAYDYNSSLQHIILPSCVEQIGYRAFYQCSNLSEITCYAIAPPEVESNAFTGIAEGAVLHVLSSAIPLYSEAEGWKNFTILPLTEEVQTLEVNLPAGSEDGRYKNMTLELVNAESGQKQKYVISDRVTYTFNGLLKKSLFNVYVKNNMGAVLGLIENIAITDDDVSVTFESLLQPQDVTLSVQTPDGTNVTSQVQIRWFDSESNYLQQSNKISGLLAGTAVRYRITLPQALGMQYIIPTDSLYTIQEDGNALVCTLQPIEEVTISGRVKDVTTGSALSGAVVSVSQKLNSLYSKAFTVKTDNKGEFTAKVFNDQSTITVSASDYLNQTLEFANFNDTTFVGEVSLKGITGATITTNLTYTTSVVEGGTAEVQNWYADYANVAYEIYNETQQRAITQFNVQYPSIVLLEEVAEGDVLKLTASSRANAFVPVTAMATIDAQNRAETTFNIVELGAIRATFTSTDNASVVGILYDNKGQMVKKYTYGNALLSISNLAEGDYTLVTMTNSTLFNSILNLSQFAASGLMEGTDYVQNTVTVKSGVVATIVNDLVPVLDESKLYYTGDKTLFSVNKTSIVAGNYLTLKGKIDFKSTYAAQVSNVNMVVDLPETCSFVENSVMVGSSIAGYTLDGNRLTIPLTGKYTDQVRFCIIPTLGGEYAPNAFAQFSLDNKDVLQPIGSAKFAVKDLTISVPSTVAKTTIPISGTALGNSTVEIYDNGIKIGETTSLANGVWSTTCELDEPYNLSTHSIYAKVTTKQGLKLQSETQNVLYDAYAIQVSKVTMFHWNPEMRVTYESVFDFLNPASKPNQWTVYYPNKKFTYTVEFTNNSPEVVSNVVLYVHAADGRIVPLSPSYDEKKDIWVADLNMGNRSDSYYPVNVSVDFDSQSELYASSSKYKEMLLDVSDGYEEYKNGRDDIFQEFSLLKQRINDSAIDSVELISVYEEVDSTINVLKKRYDLTLDSELTDSLFSEEELENTEKADSLRISNLLSDIRLEMTEFDQSFIYQTYFEYFDETTGSAVKSVSCQGVSVESLLNLGYERLLTDGKDSIYYKISNDTISCADFINNVHQTIVLSNIENAVQAMAQVRFSSPNFTATAIDMKKTLSQINSVRMKISEIVNFLSKATAATIEEDINTMLSSAKELSSAITNLTDLVAGFVKQAQEQIFAPLKLMQDRYRQLTNELNLAKAHVARSTKNISKYLFWKAMVLKIEELRAPLEFILKQKWVANIGSFITKYAPIANIVFTGATAVERLGILIGTASAIFPCEGDKLRACLVAVEAVRLIRDIGNYVGLSLGAEALLDGSAIANSEIIVGAIACVALKFITSWGIDKLSSKDYEYKINSLQNNIAQLKCNVKDPKPKPNPNKGGKNGSGQSNDEVRIDPSGYVYEGVSSNRIEGVMASCYYKETVEDMYGDLHENVVLWDAEQYAQENPLFTDENGMYRWDVPQGLWQVKFEKEGYETTYSEWLPVPPPQLEVNIGMVHNKQPEVKTARAYEDGIEVEFDKYMQLDGLTTENIFVTKNGETAAGTVTLLNEEQTYEDNPVTYASKVRFVPETSFLTTDEVVLTVSRKVKSYAGIQMETDYSQEFDIEKEIKSIIVDSIIQVSYNGEKEIVVSALPYDAAIGKKLIVNNSSSMILSISADTLTFDENGQVKLSIMGELPGTSMLTFTVAETDINSMCEVQVITEVFPTVETPVSSLASGTAVYRGTLIELSTGTKDAVIYYTLDGNCPCEEQYQIRYASPIAITDDSTVIKAIAVADGKYDSDVVEFNYTIRRNSIDVNFEKGWNWVSHSFESPISPSEFAVDEGVSRILSQTQEAIRDPQLGLVGTLTELTANESYKVETTTATERQRLSDIAWNPATPIGLNAGWNWIGYPITQIMSVNEAFATTAAETLDVVVGQNGFAQFDGEKWVGTLETMSPGMGYMYQSQSAKNVVYNTSIVSTAAAMYAHGISRNLPLVIDIHKYGQIMPVIATINNADDYALNNEDYQVAAFCGSECRGIGRVVDGLVMMNVYGNINDNITFQVSDINGEKIYNNTVSLSFIETVVGDIFNPFAITVNGTTGISEVEYSGRIKVTVLGDILKINGINADEIKYVEIYDINGLKVSRETNITKSGIRVSNLIDGVYVVVVNGNGEYSYHKIAVHKNN